MTDLRRRIHERLPGPLRGLARAAYSEAMVILLREEVMPPRGPRDLLLAPLRWLLLRLDAEPLALVARTGKARLDAGASGLRSLSRAPRRAVHRLAPDRLAEQLFDARSYVERYPDAAGGDRSPLDHYRTIGVREGRAPNPVFDVAAYRHDHPDASAFDGDVLRHYARVGRARGGTPHPLFDPRWYARRYADVGSDDAYRHYLHVGRLEARAASAAAPAGTDPATARTVFPGLAPEAARLSVIVVAEGRAAQTLRCLHALARSIPRDLGVRVILADDGAERPLAPLLAGLPGLEVLSFERHLGYARSCNAAARVATGDHLVFLGSDTAVQPGWLEALLRVAADDPRVGIVGARHIDPDGRLAEAGVRLSGDGEALRIGRGDDPDDPRYVYVREVDAVSGTCLLVRRAAWESRGGFDETLVADPLAAYDLSLALAAAGWRTVYQPAARVVHGQPAGAGAGTQGPEVASRQRFVARWGPALAARPQRARGRLHGRPRAPARGTVLVIDDKVPERDRHAGALAVWQYLQLMSEEGFEVLYLPDDGVERQPYAQDLRQLGVEVVTGHLSLGRWFARVGPSLDWVILARPFVAPRYLHHVRASSNARVLYLVHDVYALRERRRFEMTGDPEALRESKRLYRIEKELFERTDGVLALSGDELPVIRRMAPHADVSVITPYFVSAEHAPRTDRPPIRERHEVVFLGAFDHPANVDAAMVLVRDVMPAVWQQVPAARALLVGGFVPPGVQALASERVDVLGYVPDLDAVWARARMSVSPLRFGSGVKGKIVASLQAGIPVVTTPIGNEGIHLRSGVEALIGDSAADIAGHVVSLFRDPDLLESLAAAGLRLGRERFTRERARADLLSALRISDQPAPEAADGARRPASDVTSG